MLNHLHTWLFRMKRGLPFVLLSLGLLFTTYWFAAIAQNQRGNSVLVKFEDGKENDLYDESHALVIGVSNYTQGWRKLPGVLTDVKEISRVLEAQGFKVMTLLDPTVEKFQAALRTFRSRYGLRERNRLLIYFAGHGHTERLSDNRDLGYIVMHDAPLPAKDPEGFSQASIGMEEINSYALSLKSKHALFVFDSCFAGTIFRSESMPRTPPRIASMTAQPVRQFITAGDAGQAVPDDSIFRRYFARAFDQREGDLDEDGYITGEELGKYLMGSVASDSRDTQTPRYGKIRDARLSQGDVVFALPKNVLPVPTPTLSPEVAFWEAIKNSKDPAEFDAFLKQFPNGQLKDLARIRLERLRGGKSTSTKGDKNTESTPLPAPLVTPSFKIYAATQKKLPLGLIRGKLVTGDNQIAFEADGDTKRSRIWEFKDIKKLGLEGLFKFEIRLNDGSVLKLELLGNGMPKEEFEALQKKVEAATKNSNGTMSNNENGKPASSGAQQAAVAEKQKVERVITLDANKPWVDTEIDVTPNMRFEVLVNGTIDIGNKTNNVGPDGDLNARINGARYPRDNAGVGAVIMKIRYKDGRGSNILFVGKNSVGTTEQDEYGRLMIGINDDYFMDNRGSFTVTIRWEVAASDANRPKPRNRP